jgi:Arc/MetJ-type ribon-helix-helix transcriptional regulator
MAAVTVGFAIAESDRALLDELVDFYAQGNRSEFLRLAIKRMERDRFAQRMQDLQAEVREQLGGKVLSQQEVANLVREVKAKN